MPPGAKKRKALKKKQQQHQEASTNNKAFNGDNNLHGNDEQGSQESDSSLSSPGSQGNGDFGGTLNSSAAISSALVVKKDTAKEISLVNHQGLGPNSGNAIAVERGTNDKNNVVEKSHIPSNQTSKYIACQDTCGDSVKEVTPVVDSVSNVAIYEKNQHAETSTHSNLAKPKKEYQSLGKDDGKVATLPGSASGTSRKVESVRESEASVSSEEKRLLLLPGPPAVRTSWLSCCGLFDAMTGSDR